MSQAFYPTNDGHVGNIQKLTDIQLSDILNRQERLLKKRSFLHHLPDKGKKIKEHYDVIKTEMDRRQSLKPAHVKREINTGVKSADDRVSHSAANNHVSECSASNRLHEQLDAMTIQDTEMEEAGSKHQYEIAINRAKENSSLGLKEPFKLNRQLNIAKVSDLPDEIKKIKETMHAASVKPATDIPHVVEESAVAPPIYKFDSAQQIDITESLNLQQTQKHRQEELQAQLAAERLAERLHIKTEPYNPEGVDMSYRSRQEGLDSDDEDGEDRTYDIDQQQELGNEHESDPEQ